MRVLKVLGLPAVLFAIWWFASAGSTDVYRPPLRQILIAFADTWFGPALVTDVLPSLARLAIGYLAALVVGVAAGVAIGSSRRLRAATEPVLEFLRAIPPPVLVPILILIAGIGDLMKVQHRRGGARRGRGAVGHLPRVPTDGRCQAAPSHAAFGQSADHDRGAPGPVDRHHPDGDQ